MDIWCEGCSKSIDAGKILWHRKVCPEYLALLEERAKRAEEHEQREIAKRAKAGQKNK